jgi:putative flippase GtrA
MTDSHNNLSRSHRAWARHRILVAKAMRFGLVALVSGGIFVAVTALCVSGLGLDPKIGSTIGYLASLPVNFVAHRQYTFVARGVIWREALRFIVVHAANIAVSISAAAITVDGFGLHYGFGMLAVLMLVPLVTFALMNLWVFPNSESVNPI